MIPSNVQFNSQDDQPIVVVRQDISGGVNSRVLGSSVKENQMTVMYNIDIQTPGETSRRLGSVMIADDLGSNSVIGLHNFEIQGATDQLLAYHSTTLAKWDGAASSWTDLGHTFTASTEAGMVSVKESGLTPDDVVILSTDGGSNPHRVDSAGNWQDLGNTAGTGNDSPPNTTVMAWYGNRLWTLKDDLLSFSDAYPADYSVAFDTATNRFRIPVGTERAIIPTRTEGLIVAGVNEIWGLSPSAVPDPSTDKPQFITNRGLVSKKGWVNAGDDIYYFSQDGFRGLRRTEQDKLQAGVDLPISYFLEDEYNRINFAYIDRVCMVYFDNKIFIAVPTGAATFDTWIYYPALQAFTILQGWSPRSWAKYKISGEERLYYGVHGDGKVYRAWNGYTDEGTTTTNGTAINYQEEGRKEDGGLPLIKKQGGSIKIEAASSGNWDLSVYVSFDDGAYQSIGTMNLQGAPPTLPVNLPFDLAPESIIRKIFHLDPYPAWYQMRIKIVSNENTGSDEIKIYTRGFITFQTELSWGD